MRKVLKAGTRWVLVLMLAMLGLLAVSVAILPEIFRQAQFLPPALLDDAPIRPMPPVYYILSLLTLLAFLGVVVALFIERFERVTVAVFVALRMAVEIWQYIMGRHSLVYLVGTLLAHLLVGGLVLWFFSGRMRLPPGQIGPGEDIP